jgi:hypothetical protein
MAFSLFRKENNAAAQRERRERLERRVAEGFRQLALVFQKAAEVVEARRLERNGYESQEKFLERTDRRRR